MDTDSNPEDDPYNLTLDISYALLDLNYRIAENIEDCPGRTKLIDSLNSIRESVMKLRKKLA